MVPKIILAILASGAGFSAYALYFRSIFRGVTKPHIFSWFVWGLLTGIAGVAQLAGGAGPGGVVTSINAVLCLSVAALALRRGEKHITVTDWLSFAGALLAIVLWQLTKEPLLAVILVTIADMLAFVPTFRKTYLKPYEETLAMYILSTTQFFLAFLALESYTPTTWLYPVATVGMNGLFTAMVLYRRRSITNILNS